MFFKQKRVRKSDRFSPRYIKSDTHRRELAIANYSMAFIQFALGIALVIVSYQSFVIFHARVSDLSPLHKYALPAVFLLGGLYAIRAGIVKFRRIRSEELEVREFYENESSRE